MTKIRLRFVQAFTALGKPYYYFRKPGCPRVKLPGLPGSEAFMAAYQAAEQEWANRTSVARSNFVRSESIVPSQTPGATTGACDDKQA